MSFPADHHHRNTTKVSHKSFKSRIATKNSLRDKSKGKVEKSEKGSRKTPHQHVMNKLDRKNQNKQKRIASKQDQKDAQKLFTGRSGAPRIVTVVPLADDVSCSSAIDQLNLSLDIETIRPTSEEHGSPIVVNIDRFKQRLAYLATDRDMLSAMDACQVADYVIFVLSQGGMNDSDESMLKAIESQGISNVHFVVQGLDHAQPKKQLQIQHLLRDQIQRYFPEQELPVLLHMRQPCQNLIRSLCTSPPKGIRWRNEHAWMMIENLQWQTSATNDGPIDTTEMIVTGVIRGNPLQADRLLQVGDWGEYQISKVTAAPLPITSHGKGNVMSIDIGQDEQVLSTPGTTLETLDHLAPEEVVMEDVDIEHTSVMTTGRKSILLDDEYDHTIEEGEDIAPRPKRLPRGTSKYQAAWYLDDVSDSGSDLSDIEYQDEGDDVAMDDFDAHSQQAANTSQAAQSEAADNDTELSEDELAEASEAAVEAYRSTRKNAQKDDLEYPDEIELHPSVIARERLARYRGLKNPKTSPWDREPDLPHQPPEWPRLLDIQNYRAAYNRVLHEARYGGGIPAGTRVHIYLRDLPVSLKQGYESSATKRPLLALSLLRHEHKETATHYRITLASSRNSPLESKDPVVIQVGSRRFTASPLYSEAINTPNDVHRLLRFLHPGVTAIASVVAPVTWGSCPVLVFRRKEAPDSTSPTMEAGMDVDKDESNVRNDSGELELIATGTALPPSPSRTIAKRAILTGQPFKINRRVVTVRYMFFNAEDVRYFSRLPLSTNRGRKGWIKESLGTHGMFKAEFEGGVGAVESIGISLWKRVWPTRVERFVTGCEDAGAGAMSVN